MIDRDNLAAARYLIVPGPGPRSGRGRVHVPGHTASLVLQQKSQMLPISTNRISTSIQDRTEHPILFRCHLLLLQTPAVHPVLI
jgi:hypothetical protein